MIQQAMHPQDWPPDIYSLLLDGSYHEAIQLFERLIEEKESKHSHYWYFGLLLILNGQEVEGQTIWSFKMAEAKDKEFEQWSNELVAILRSEGQRQYELNNIQMSWTICQHIREIMPENLDNLLQLIMLSKELAIFEVDDLQELNIIHILKTFKETIFRLDLFQDVVLELLPAYPSSPIVIEFLDAGSSYLQKTDTDFVEKLIEVSIHIGNVLCYPQQSIKILEIARRFTPSHVDLLKYLSSYYQSCHQYEKAIEIAQECYQLSTSLLESISANYILLMAFMVSGRYWRDSQECFARHLDLIKQFIEEKPQQLPQPINQWIISSAFFQPYLRDSISLNRFIQNKLAYIYNENVLKNYSQRKRSFDRVMKPRKGMHQPLKVGYLSHCLKEHSVGWLSRWLFKYHNRDHLKVFSYFVDYKSSKSDALQTWIIQQSDSAYRLPLNGENIAEKINDDGIDLLIDLDSLTLDICCEVLALKPAPVQATWLGWDASGIPSIDYFIVDSYVLPENAEEHYSEKLLRMPNAYLAVDGFEIGVPSIRRESLDIPQEAVIYLSAQQGFKRHPHTVQLQMQILKEVPKSYFLVKTIHGNQSIQDFFIRIAEEEGVTSDRLRFLPHVPTEMIHRANLSIADVVLDTYPYNGATTTMETLWVGIPVVTRVGQTFSSRNSYTMMVNAGITEGIAWSDEEYVEWGVKLGRDLKLRQQISWKLMRSRQVAPLWNSRDFTRDMERAYHTMVYEGL